jgi:vacuolar-type H+-ATPase subunit D/Vma8
MCRAWPGYRCSQHSDTSIRKISRQIYNLEKLKENLVSEQRLNFENREDSTKTWEEFAEEDQATAVLGKYQVEIDVLEAKRDELVVEFHATSSGRKTLQELIDNVERSDVDRYDAAAELAAAETRSSRQRKLGQILQNVSTPMPVKILAAQNELKKSKRDLKMLHASSEVLKRKLSTLQAEIWTAKNDGDAEEVKMLVERRNALMKELTFVEKQQRQIHAHVDNTKSWLKRFTDKMIDKTFDWNEQLIGFSVRYMI